MRFRLRWQPSTAVLVLALAAAGLAGCRSSPNVAAYVGDATILVADLDRAVNERLADDTIDAAFGDDEAAYTRTVLSMLIDAEVYDAAAERYGVEVDDSDVAAYFAARFGASETEADSIYAQAAAQEGLSRADVRETLREQLVSQRIAAAEGLAAGTDDATLRQRYAQVADQLSTTRLGYVNVPDQATADAVLAELTANPASFPDVAQRYPGGVTTSQVQLTTNVPELIADQVAAAAPDTGFTITAGDVEGVVVVLVGEPGTPSFAEVRDQLAVQVIGEGVEAAEPVVADFTDELGVTLNPRYGSYDEGEVAPADPGSVQFLDTPDPAAGSGTAVPSTGSSGG